MERKFSKRRPPKKLLSERYGSFGHRDRNTNTETSLTMSKSSRTDLKVEESEKTSIEIEEIKEETENVKKIEVIAPPEFHYTLEMVCDRGWRSWGGL